MNNAMVADTASTRSRPNSCYRTAAAGREHAACVSRRERDLVQESRELRHADLEPEWPRYFVVQGEVEGERVRASWFAASLRMTTALRARGELLVNMGETFCIQRGWPAIPASLESPMASMLTLVRSCDQLDRATFGPLGKGMSTDLHASFHAS